MLPSQCMFSAGVKPGFFTQLGMAPSTPGARALPLLSHKDCCEGNRWVLLISPFFCTKSTFYLSGAYSQCLSITQLRNAVTGFADFKGSTLWKAVSLALNVLLFAWTWLGFLLLEFDFKALPTRCFKLRIKISWTTPQIWSKELNENVKMWDFWYKMLQVSSTAWCTGETCSGEPSSCGCKLVCTGWKVEMQESLLHWEPGGGGLGK